jgi:putative lipoic acid-binding regulatory protein
MSDMPSIQLLEKTHQFPGTYMFKVIGKVENGFMARVIAAVRDVLQQEADPPFHFRETVGGRHVSVTLEPRVQTAQQVLAIYRRIQGMAGLVLLL